MYIYISKGISSTHQQILESFAIEKVETQDNDAENGIHHIVDEEPGANGEVSGAGKTIALY